MKVLRLLPLIIAFAAVSPALADVIDGTDAIYLSGRTDIVVPDPADPWPFLLRHTAPTPEEAQETHPDYIPVVAGSVIEAAAPATGGINFYNGLGPPFFLPDGDGVAGSNLLPIDGISGFVGPMGPLVGLFLGDNIPDTGPAPPALDFTPGGMGTDFSVLMPGIGQVFYIGDGFNSVPAAQSFIAPAGATRLFLGIADGFGFVGQPGAYDDNDGAYEIDLDVSLQVDIDIKFCSDPNAFNCKKKGVLPVTIFGTSPFDVLTIDVSTLQLCTADLSVCTGEPRDYTIADRGDPTSDLGASMCALVDLGDGIYEEQDYLTQDGFLDMDVAFEAVEVQDMLSSFCGSERGATSEPLIVTGFTEDGIFIHSSPIGNAGIDQLVKKN